MAIALEKQLHEYWDMMDTTQKKSVLSMIKSFLQPAEKTTRISIEQYNKELDEAMARIDAGEYVTQEEIEKESEKW